MPSPDAGTRRGGLRAAPAGRARGSGGAGRRERRGPAGALLLAGALACGAPAPAPLTLGATTTAEDSGLLEALLGAFRAEHPDMRVRALTGGSGEILALGRRGDLDLLLTHDPVAESLFVASGHATQRRALMRSAFVLAGPAEDPADVATADGAADAFARIAAAAAPFVSRADDSGTHRKERLLWHRALGAGVDGRPEGEARPEVDRPAAGAAWYVEAGVGMGDALRIAGARGAYVLTDRPTFVMLRAEHGLAELLAGDSALVNPYAVTVVAASPRRAAAEVLARWLTEGGGRAVIAGFGREAAGEPLFVPAGPPPGEGPP